MARHSRGRAPFLYLIDLKYVRMALLGGRLCSLTDWLLRRAKPKEQLTAHSAESLAGGFPRVVEVG